MLAHKYRFHGYRSLGFVFRRGQTVRGRHLILRVYRHPHRVHNRLAVVVSKKVAKRAVRRNRIRRRIFESLRRAWPRLAAPYDLAIVVRHGDVALLGAQELEAEIGELLAHARLLEDGA